MTHRTDEQGKCEACEAWEHETGYGKICTHLPTDESVVSPTIPERVEEFAKNLSASVRKFAGYGQYPDDGVEQKAYRDGVETAIGMMYIDITGTPKTSGMLVPLLTETDQQAREEVAERIAWLDRIAESYLHVEATGTPNDSMKGQIHGFKQAYNIIKTGLIDSPLSLSNPPSQV